MGVVKKRGYYYWVKRVPKRYQGIVLGSDGLPVQQVRQALHTDSKAQALVKATQVEAAKIAEWESALAGRPADARMHYLAAKELAESQGFSYRQLNDILTDSLPDMLPRLEAALGTHDSPAPEMLTEAILGAVNPVMPTLSGVLDEYIDRTKTRHLKKSDAQKHRWKLPRQRAVANFLKVTSESRGGGANTTVDKITRADTLRFRDWWAERIQNGYSAKTANKELGHLAEIFSTWAELNGLEIKNPFSKLALEGEDNGRTPPFTREWVKSVLLKPDAFAGLNDEARDIFLVTINTGLRPSEVSDAPVEDFRVFDNIPHIIVAPNGRELKVKHTRREIPLTGVSLEAARRIVARGGIMRYPNKASSWSALVNKYMVNNGLKETPKHTAYSVRHYVEDALLASKVDDRVRADILGHKYERPNYGDGGGLEGRLAALRMIAL